MVTKAKRENVSLIILSFPLYNLLAEIRVDPMETARPVLPQLRKIPRAAFPDMKLSKSCKEIIHFFLEKR